MLRITWLILAILLLIGCNFLILLIGVCPTGYITILYAFFASSCKDF
ncbi:hypothetical protein LINGRAHAP2_LOCUS33599 [Linum grandiflorum]